MLKFACSACGYSRGVSDKYADKTAKCPKCQSSVKIANIPLKPWMDGELVKFYCSDCEKKLAAKTQHAGKKMRCIKCGKIHLVPDIQKNIAEISEDSDSISILRVEESGSDQGFDDGGFGDLMSMEAAAEAVENPLLERPVDRQQDRADSVQTTSRPNRDIGDSPSHDKVKKIVTICGGTICVIILLMLFYSISNALDGDLKSKKKGNNTIHEYRDYFDAYYYSDKFLHKIHENEFYAAKEYLSTTLKLLNDKELLLLSKFTEDINYLKISLEDSYIKKINDTSTGYLMQYNCGPNEGDHIIMCVIERAKFKPKIHGIWSNFQGHEPVIYTTEAGFNFHTMIMIEHFSGPFIWVLKYKVPIIVSIFLVGILYSICMIGVYVKAGESGIAAIIPVYNLYVLAQIGDLPGWVGIVAALGMLIPIIGPIGAMIASLFISIRVAKAFERGVFFGLGLFIMPIIFYPILAFSGPMQA